MKIKPTFLIIFLLLFYLFTRSFYLLSFPPFLDEIVHIDWANDLYSFHPFTGADNGKLFGLWWMALFYIPEANDLFVVRFATILFNLFGIAVLYRIAKDIADTSTAIIAVILSIWSPYNFFYDRFALVDSYVNVFALLTLLFSLRFSKTSNILFAILSGLMVVGAILAKATGIVMLAIPFIVYVLSSLSLRMKIKGAVITYGVFVVSWLPIFYLLMHRGYSYWSTATTVVGTNDHSDIFLRTIDNFFSIIQIDQIYFSSAFIIVAIILIGIALFIKPKSILLLGGGTLVPLVGLLVFATKLSARYFHFHIPFLLLLLSVSAYVIVSRFFEHRFQLQIVLGSLLVLWILAFSLPFHIQYWDDPEQLNLPRLDRLEYITSDASGFALDEVINFIQNENSENDVNVLGLLSNCDGMRVYIARESTLKLECPLLRLEEIYQQNIVQLTQELASQNQPLWIIVEESEYNEILLERIDLIIHVQKVVTRPDDIVSLHIYKVETSDS